MSDDNVIDFTGTTCLPLDPDRLLEKAKGKLQTVLILGYDAEGKEYFASSESDGAIVLWLLERVKLDILTFDNAE